MAQKDMERNIGFGHVGIYDLSLDKLHMFQLSSYSCESKG